MVAPMWPLASRNNDRVRPTLQCGPEAVIATALRLHHDHSTRAAAQHIDATGKVGDVDRRCCASVDACGVRTSVHAHDGDHAAGEAFG